MADERYVRRCPYCHTQSVMENRQGLKCRKCNIRLHIHEVWDRVLRTVIATTTVEGEITGVKWTKAYEDYVLNLHGRQPDGIVKDKRKLEPRGRGRPRTLTEYEMEDIKALYRMGILRADIARRFNVRDAVITQIVCEKYGGLA